jgi:hypothetical protein
MSADYASSAESLSTVTEAATPAPKREKKRRAEPPALAPLQAGDATRNEPLQVPRREQPSGVAPFTPGAPGASQSHTPPPLTSSTPPPPVGHADALRPSRPPSAPSMPPGHGSVAPPRAGSPRLDRVPSMAQIAARYLRLPTSQAQSAAVGVFAALVVGILVIMIAATLRGDPPSDAPGEGPVIAARPLGTGAPVAVPTLPTPAATPAPSPSPTPRPTAAAPPPNGGCRLVTVPRRVAGPSMPSVPPMGASAPGQSRVAIGYASSRNHPEGIIVNLDDLSVEPRYSEELAGPAHRVTPLTDRSPVTFAVDTDDARVQNLRTIPSSPPLRVGTSYYGFVRLNDTTSPTVIWPGARFEGISEPWFAVTPRDGLGVAFRAGRGSGDVLAGWLTPSGTADGDLVRVDAGAREVGAPTIAASDRTVVVAFSARAPGESWHIRVALGPRGKAPTTSRELFTTRPGAADAILPLVYALPSGGFLMQSLEGPAGARRVVVRSFDERMVLQGVALELAQGAAVLDAPGALVFRAGRVLALHPVQVDKSVELRGAVLVCG